jgi:hypothetical protein
MEWNFEQLLLLALTLCPRHAFAVSDFYATSCCAARSGGRNQISASRNRKFACSLNANIAQARAQTLRAKGPNALWIPAVRHGKINFA